MEEKWKENKKTTDGGKRIMGKMQEEKNQVGQVGKYWRKHRETTPSTYSKVTSQAIVPFPPLLSLEKTTRVLYR